MFGGLTFGSGGAVPTGMQIAQDAINPAARQMLDTDQQRKVIQCYQEIDNILKQECIFCGPILIDMIDNDLEGGLSGLEFGNAKSQVSQTEEDSYWKIS